MDDLDWMLTPQMLEIGRQAIENELAIRRENRSFDSTVKSGSVIRERDNRQSKVIRFGSNVALEIGIKAILAARKG